MGNRARDASEWLAQLARRVVPRFTLADAAALMVVVGLASAGGKDDWLLRALLWWLLYGLALQAIALTRHVRRAAGLSRRQRQGFFVAAGWRLAVAGALAGSNEAVPRIFQSDWVMTALLCIAATRAAPQTPYRPRGKLIQVLGLSGAAMMATILGLIATVVVCLIDVDCRNVERGHHQIVSWRIGVQPTRQPAWLELAVASMTCTASGIATCVGLHRAVRPNGSTTARCWATLVTTGGLAGAAGYTAWLFNAWLPRASPWFVDEYALDYFRETGRFEVELSVIGLALGFLLLSSAVRWSGCLSPDSQAADIAMPPALDFPLFWIGLAGAFFYSLDAMRNEIIGLMFFSVWEENLYWFQKFRFLDLIFAACLLDAARRCVVGNGARREISPASLRRLAGGGLFVALGLGPLVLAILGAGMALFYLSPRFL
jgi:hypothetical protein